MHEGRDLLSLPVGRGWLFVKVTLQTRLRFSDFRNRVSHEGRWGHRVHGIEEPRLKNIVECVFAGREAKKNIISI